MERWTDKGRVDESEGMRERRSKRKEAKEGRCCTENK